jgi:hypothetical protein
MEGHLQQVQANKETTDQNAEEGETIAEATTAAADQ